jgi:hypothetical protein
MLLALVKYGFVATTTALSLGYVVEWRVGRVSLAQTAQDVKAAAKWVVAKFRRKTGNT